MHSQVGNSTSPALFISHKFSRRKPSNFWVIMTQLMAFIFILYTAFGLLCFYLYGDKLTTSVISEGIKEQWYSIPFGVLAQM